MFYPESSHQAQANFPLDTELPEKQLRQSFYQKLLNFFKNFWDTETVPPVDKTLEVYAFRFHIK